MTASKMFDVVLGIDIHVVFTPVGVPIPMPHPFIGFIIEWTSFLPFLGKTVWVNGLPGAQARTEGTCIIGLHFPIGGVAFLPPVPDDCEIFMGSATVNVEGNPQSRTGNMVMSCNTIGIPLPGRGFALYAPTSVVLCIPWGAPVMVGGPPVPAFTIASYFQGLVTGAIGRAVMGFVTKKAGNFLKKHLLDKPWFKNIATKVHDAASKVTKFLPANMRNKVHQDLCAKIGHPVDAATGKVLTTIVDFALPGPIPLVWERTWYSVSSHEGSLGHGWHHAYDLSLGVVEENNALHLRLADGRNAYLPLLEVGGSVFLEQEQLTLRREEEWYILTDKEYLEYHFRSATVTQHSQSTLHCILRSGAQILFDYDQNNALVQITDSGGRILKVSTDSSGRITKIEAPHPGVRQAGGYFPIIRYDYGAQGDLIASHDALDAAHQFVYQNHLLVQETNRNGLSFYFEYDGDDHNAWCTHTWGDEGIHDNYLTYDKENGTTRVVNSRGHETVYHWNNDGLIWKTIDAAGGVFISQYDDACHILRTIDEIQRVTTYSYDANGNLNGILHPDGTTTAMGYDGHSLVSAVDQNGGGWSWEYDKEHRMVTRNNAEGEETQYRYEGPVVKEIISPNEQKTILEYDKEYNLIELQSANKAINKWSHDALGRMTKSIDQRGSLQERKYDLKGKLTKLKTPDGKTRLMEYDPEGNLIYFKDQQREASLEYKGLNRLGSRTENKQRVEFKYDTEENLVGIINEHGYAYRFDLDHNGRVIKESGFDGLLRKYKRDAAGQLVTLIKPEEKYSNYNYDQAGRVTQIDHWDNSTESFSYRADGRLLSAKNQNSIVSFDRDRLGRILAEYQGGYIVNSEYNNAGDRIRIKSSLGADVIISRNELGDVLNINANQGSDDPWSVNFTRDMLGLELERTLPGGVSSIWKRDHLGRPAAQTTTVGRNKTASRSYKWGPDYRLKTLSIDGKGELNFEHDLVGNLKAATYADGSEELKIPDAIGNLFKNQGRSDREYGPAGQLLRNGKTRFEYDPEGNLITKILSDGTRWKYDWNASGNLSKVTRPDGQVINFEYDALGRRISKKYGRQRTRWVWDGNVPLHEWKETLPPSPSRQRKQLVTAETTTNYFDRKKEEKLTTAPSVGPPVINKKSTEPQIDIVEMITSVDGELTTWLFEPGTFAPMAKITPGRNFSIITDHLGTPVSMYDEQGRKSWELELSIYGDVRKLEGWREQCPFRYPGQYEDVETGLYYNRFRYFDPEAGGYISQDPIGLAGGKRLYSYAHDVNSFIDPFGLAPIDVFRFDKRSPAEIKASGGFEPWKPNANVDLYDYAKNNTPSQYVSTTPNLQSAIDFGNDNYGGEGYVYKITIDDSRGVNVNETLGGKSPFPQENEFAVKGRIDANEIVDHKNLKDINSGVDTKWKCK